MNTSFVCSQHIQFQLTCARAFESMCYSICVYFCRALLLLLLFDCKQHLRHPTHTHSLTHAHTDVLEKRCRVFVYAIYKQNVRVCSLTSTQVDSFRPAVQTPIGGGTENETHKTQNDRKWHKQLKLRCRERTRHHYVPKYNKT